MRFFLRIVYSAAEQTRKRGYEMEKEKTPIVERKENELVSYIVVLRGLINYHKRMVLPLSSMQCRNDKGISYNKFLIMSS